MLVGDRTEPAAAFRRREMQPDDVDACAALVASHPVIGPRYGRSATRLARAWKSVLGREAIRTGVIEVTAGSRQTVCFAGITVCVDEAFVAEGASDRRSGGSGWSFWSVSIAVARRC